MLMNFSRINSPVCDTYLSNDEKEIISEIEKIEENHVKGDIKSHDELSKSKLLQSVSTSII